MLIFAFFASLAIHLITLSIWSNWPTKILVKQDNLVIHIQPKANHQNNLLFSRPQKTSTTSGKAPLAPTAEEWAFASSYALKNGKGYRYNWGKQVRSMMGTATDGPDQGAVRFHIEIAPDGKLTTLETLWTTSKLAESLARKAIMKMPSLPPTPNGKPLIFERTITFSPFAPDDTPIYRDDCLPDSPVFNNPFVWDGKSPQEYKKNKTSEQLSPAAMAECLKQLPQDSIEGISAHGQRQLDQWESSKINKSK